MRKLVFALAAASFVAAASFPVATGDDAPGGSGVAAVSSSVPLPRADEFTKLVLEVAKSYPTDGTHKYHWPKGSTWEGTTRDLVYEGKKVCSGDPEKRCYCCGLTFEVFFRAYELYCQRAKKPFRILDLDPRGIDRLRHEWFGPTAKDRTTLLKAITLYKLGKQVPIEQARAGDFCQLWRHSGSGHSVVLLEVIKKDGKPEAIRYWSTQGSTNGIGERVEKFSSEKSGVILEETYFARVGQ